MIYILIFMDKYKYLTDTSIKQCRPPPKQPPDILIHIANRRISNNLSNWSATPGEISIGTLSF